METRLQVATADEVIRLGGLEYRGPIDLEAHGYVANGALALILVTREDGYPERLANVTINVPGHTPLPNTIFVKDYSECAGMVALLEEKGWGKRTGQELKNGFVTIPEVEMIGDLLQFVDELANERQR